jgi:hypothetical protein
MRFMTYWAPATVTEPRALDALLCSLDVMRKPARVVSRYLSTRPRFPTYGVIIIDRVSFPERAEPYHD